MTVCYETPQNFKYEKYEKEVYKDVEKKGTKINDKKIVIIDEEK